MPPSEIDRILCPFESPASSGQALARAFEIARWTGARVTAVHVTHPDVAPGLDPSVIDRGELLQWLVDTLGVDVAHVEFDTLQRRGLAAREIVAVAQELPAPLIVMGTHGSTGIDRLVLGSVAEQVLRLAPCPVITVPQRSTLHLSPARMHVVCAIDFSEASLAALEFLLANRLTSHATITLLHVLDTRWQDGLGAVVEPLPYSEAQAVAADAARREHDARRRLMGLRPEGHTERLRVRTIRGRASAEILRIADEEAAELIALGRHSQGVLDRALFGSTAQQVVRRAVCPVLTLAPPQP